MSTGRELVSAIRGYHKMLSTDNLINDRTILYELKNNRLGVKNELIKKKPKGEHEFHESDEPVVELKSPQESKK